MAAQIKLLYFPLDGRGEAIRLTLVIGGVAYEDEIIEFKDWPARKPTTPFGSVPVLYVDGKPLAQTNSILRYVGRLAHLYPADDLWTAAKIDEIADTVEDHVAVLVATVFNYSLSDEQKKANFEDFTKENGSITVWARNLDKTIAANGGSHAVGNNLTTADVKIATIINMWKRIPGIPGDFADQFPNIKKSVDSVNNHPKVQEYYAKKKQQ